MSKYSRGDLITSNVVPAPIYTDLPGPSLYGKKPKIVGYIQQKEIAVILDVIDSQHLLVMCNSVVGVVLIGTIFKP